MGYCLEKSVNFLKQTFTSTTFNELLYRLLAACFITFGLAGLNFFQPFLPVILLLAIVTVSETTERWLAVPHVTIISLTTIIFWLLFIWSQQKFSTPVERVVSQSNSYLLKMCVIPLMVSTYTGSLITLSDIWKVQIDVGVMLAVLPTLAEVLVFSAIYALSGIPFGWAVLTAFCLCVWDHRLVQRRATLMEKYRVGHRHDLPQLMRSSLVINIMFSAFAFTFGLLFVSPCWTTLSRNSTGAWTVAATEPASGWLASSAHSGSGSDSGSGSGNGSDSVLFEVTSYVVSLCFGLTVAGLLFVFARYTGAPKTQMLSTLVVSSLPLLFYATSTNSRPVEPYRLSLLHGAEPLSCLLAGAGLIYGWKKSRSSESSIFDSASKVAHARNNVKVLLYAVNITLHCYLGYIMISYCLSSSDELYAQAQIVDGANREVELPQQFRQSFRAKTQRQHLVIAVVAIVAGSLAKVVTVTAVLRWKYAILLKHSLYMGSSTVAKGSLAGVLAYHIIMLRIAVPDFAELHNSGQKLRLLSGHQLAYAMNIIVTMVYANIIANPLATLLSFAASRSWRQNRRPFSSDVELN